MTSPTPNSSDNNNGDNTVVRVYGFLMNPPYGDQSPSCTKLLTFLKMTQTEYEYVPNDVHRGKGSPKGKMPWIYAPELLGDAMSDSTLILDALQRADPAKYDLDVNLSDTEKAIGWAMKVMVEESLYFSILYVRWGTDQFNTVTIPTYFSNLPWFLQKSIGWFIQRKMIRDLRGQGTGLLTDTEITFKAAAELRTLSHFLGDKMYFMGSTISSYDATMYAFLVGFIRGPWDHPIIEAARSHQNLVEYVERMQAQFWGQRMSDPKKNDMQKTSPDV